MSNTATQTDTPAPPTTQEVLAGMLTENTGRSFLDSGDHYGRNHERNQGVDFDAQDEVTHGGYGLFPTLNVYHWLLRRVEYEPEMDALLQAFSGREDRENSSYMADMKEFVAEQYPDATGLYGDREPFTVNTYNGDCSLSQILQFHYFELTEFSGGRRHATPYIALQIHGGCDARGGYTRPRIFQITGDGAEIFQNNDVGTFCDGNDECDARWYSDDGGYNWYSDEGQDRFKGDDIKPNDDGHYICPHCKKGHLLPSW